MSMKWRPLTMPKKVDFDESTLTESYGLMTVQPLEMGFGTTLGNALRRVLLSSLQGAAAQFIRIDGVEHEFSTVPGVREDVITKVTDIYYARRHLQVDMVLNPPTDTASKLNSQLRLEKLTALIDAMTGGWFGKKLAGDYD